MAYPNPYYQQNYNAYQQAAIQQFQPQSSMIIHVQSEAQAREWAVAPNSSVTFIDDSKPYCYTKSMGMSQLEPPVFKRFRLEEEDATQPQILQEKAQTAPQYD